MATLDEWLRRALRAYAVAGKGKAAVGCSLQPAAPAPRRLSRAARIKHLFDTPRRQEG